MARTPSRWEDVPYVILAVLCALSLMSRVVILLGL
jgi:hypothetical protein